jgi:septum formation protein
MASDFVFLASVSPRRRALLSQIGVSFQLLAVPVDEAVRAGEGPAEYVERLARAKAGAAWAVRPHALPAPVLAADTAVVLDGRIFGKPVDAPDGARMLRELSGRTHAVLTAVALAGAEGCETRLSRSEVTFRDVADAEIHEYWRTGEPRDKAGGYAIQGRAAVFVAMLRGSYSGVMGLPLYETASLLEWAGVPRWRSLPPGSPSALPLPRSPDGH